MLESFRTVWRAKSGDPVSQIFGKNLGRYRRFVLRFTIAEELIEQHCVIPQVLFKLLVAISYEQRSSQLVYAYLWMQSKCYDTHQSLSGRVKRLELPVVEYFLQQRFSIGECCFLCFRSSQTRFAHQSSGYEVRRFVAPR